MSNIQAIHKQPSVIINDSLRETDFKIYVAPVNTKRFSDHLQAKLDKKNSIFAHIISKSVKAKANAATQSLRQKAKQTNRKNSVFNLFKQSSGLNLRRKYSQRKTQTIEKTMENLQKNLDIADKLHIMINVAIKKNREHLSQKVSDIELGYLSRLVMNKIHRLSLDSEASKSQRFKTIDEIKDIFDVIEDYLKEDVKVFLSIDRILSLGDRKMISNIKRQIKKLRSIQRTFLEMIYHIVQGKRISLRQSTFRRSI